MKKLVLLLLPVFLVSCGAHKKSFPTASPKTVAASHAMEDAEPEPEFLEEIEATSKEDILEFDLIQNAKEFLGTAYQYGGTSRAGIDCSGLVYSVFLLRNIALPRSSRAMAQIGEKLPLNLVSPGDLLFFETGRKKNVISHVGMIIELVKDRVFFIHSTTSRGVIISSLDEDYWQQHFVMARRIL